MLLVALRGGMVEPTAIISDRQARGIELLVGIVSIPLLIYAVMVSVHSHWTITFDICLFYAVFINRTVLGLFSGIKNVASYR